MNRDELKNLIQQEIAKVREDLLVDPIDVPDDYKVLKRDTDPAPCDDEEVDNRHNSSKPYSPYRLACSSCGSVMVMQEDCGCEGASLEIPRSIMPVHDMHDEFQSEHEFGSSHHEGAYRQKLSFTRLKNTLAKYNI